MKKTFLLFYCLILIMAFTLAIQPILAADTPQLPGSDKSGADNSGADNSGDGGSGGSSVSLSDVNPLGVEGISGMRTVIGRVINGVLGITGSFALFMFIYGGFMMLTSGGQTEKIQKGKNVLTWAIIGILVILGSYAVVNFIFTAINSTGTQ